MPTRFRLTSALIALMLLFPCSPSLHAQVFGIEVEVVNENIGLLVGALGVTDLTGYSTTHVYATTENSDDFVSSISGDATNPTFVNTSTSFYHAALGAGVPNGINSLLFPVYPDLAYDSWVTIGLSGTPNALAGEANVSTVQSTNNPWFTNFDPGGGLPGGNIAIDDEIGGAWYALNGDANGVAGDDLKVLIGQFTSTGDLDGQFYIQFFINGDGSNEFRDTFYYGTEPLIDGCTDLEACNFNPEATNDDDSCTYPDGYPDNTVDCDGLCLSDADGDGVCDPDEVPGCTDGMACNYDGAATDDDGSCSYAEPGLDCDGNCLADADGDGICDGEEIAGCTDDMACNYDMEATDDDGSCAYAEDGLDCDGNCLADADGDGICDGDEVPGCTDDMACNYDSEATDDDGSCTYAEDGLDCDGNCLADADGDGICDGNEIPGCTDDMACNYDLAATDEDGSCTYAEDGLDCDGNCLADADGDGICDGDEIPGCTDDTANNYDPAATDDDGSCDYACGPEWGEPTTYPSVATVLALITVDGDNADMDDAVAAYVGDELRGTGDIIDFDGATYVNMTVYLAGGEEMVNFLFFNQDECATCTMDAGLTAMSFGEYGSFDDPLMFDANCSATTLEVAAMEGWNYVSTNVMPENYAISSLFEDALGGDLLKVLGDDVFALGGSYTPGIPSVFNSLQTHSDAAGYVIKLSADGLWASSGEPLDAASTPLDLNEGWNIIGYVPQVAMSVEDALATIDGVVGTVIDGQNGTVWNPANPNEFNSLLDMEPGRSYWVRMLEAATLTYPEAAPEDGPGMAIAGLRSDDAAQQMTGWTVIRSPFAAAVAAEILLDEQPVEGEAYIGAFVGETCMAARPVVGHAGSTAAQMAILLEEPAEVTFRLWVEGTVYASGDLLDLNGGEELGQAGQTLPVLRFGSTANAVVETDLLASFSLAPMPARDMTWMDLDVLMDGQVRISVLDARGAEIAVLHEGQLAAGQHRMPIAVGHWAAGTYFVKGTGPNGVFRSPLIVH